MSDIESRAQTWTQPISEASPAGEDCRYDDEFEQVDIEIKKLQSVEGLIPDWQRVEELCTMLLAGKTKDTTLLSALCVALLNNGKYEGLAAGFKAYHDIAESYWEVMYPALRRLRGRAGDYTWTLQTITRYLGQVQPAKDDYTAVAACQEHFTALDTLLRERFGDLHPAVGPLTRELEHHLSQTTPPPPPAPEPAAGQDIFGAEQNTPVDPDSEPLAPRQTAVAQVDGMIPAAPAAPPTPVVTGSAALSLDQVASDQQAEHVVEQAQKALSMVSEYYRQRSEQLEAEKKKLEEQLAYAGRVIKLEGEVDKMLSGEEDEGDGGGDGDNDD
jgi:type VI secretion system ImpA/VasJ family protein